MTEVAQRPTDLTPEQAHAFVEHVRSQVEDIQQQIVTAYRGRAWLALGCTSWDQMCARYFGGVIVQIPRTDRPELVAALVESGMSQRAVASAVGISQASVHRVAAAASTDSSESVEATTPRTTTGVNGKTYAVRVVDKTTGELTESPPAPPTDDELVEAIDKRVPGTKARIEGIRLGTRFTRAVGGIGDVPLMLHQYGPEALAASIDPTFLSVAVSTLRDAHRAAEAIEKAQRPGLRVIKE